MLVSAGLLVALTLWSTHRARSNPPVVAWTGETQGTQFHFRIVEPPVGIPAEQWTRLAADVLEQVERTFSRWRPDSELSRLNATPAATATIEDDSLGLVLCFALRLAEQTGGAFDPTLAPMLKLWGFGPGPVPAAPPSETALADVRQRVGWHRVSVRHGAGRWTLYRDGDVELDLDAVAQGFTADAVATALRARGATNVMVEIGGEVVVSGHNAQGRLWRIGVDLPLPDTLPGERLAGVLHLTDCAVATSGGYRRRRTTAGHDAVIHIFDGRLGRPLTRERMSVTVVARDGLTADGLATAAFILGPDEGIPWLTNHWSAADALFLEVTADGTVNEWCTPNFAVRTRYERLTGVSTPATR